MKKYLITGCSGFVSRHFLELLENNRVRSLVKGVDVSYPDFSKENFQYVVFEFEKINLLHRKKTERLIHELRPDYIVHLASYSSVAFSWKRPVLSFQNNTNIYLNLLEAVKKLDASARILSVGSSEEYGDVSEHDLPLTEEHSVRPISPYAVARVSQEFISKVYTKGYGLDIVMTRSFNHIGPYQKDIFVVASFIKQLVKIKDGGARRELIAGDTAIVRDFIDVRDVVSAYHLLLDKGVNGEIYNVCSGVGISLQDIIKTLCGLFDIKVTIKVDPKLIRPQDNKMIIGSNNKLKGLGWDQKYKLEDTLKNLIQYWELKLH